MAAETWVNDAGTARKLQQIWVNDAGTARQIQEIWVNDNGTARLIYQALTVTISDLVVSYVGGTPAEYYLTSGGSIQKRDSAVVTTVGSWITNAAFVGQFECRATMISGSVSSGTIGAWQSLSTTRSWTRGAALGTFQQCRFTLEIRNASTAVVVDSATITLEADRS